jgi:redox-sensitive bicupin YhaK (pirin superfamily)
MTLMTPKHHNMMTYAYKGSIKVGERVVMQGEMALLSQGEWVELQANDASGVLLFIGEPINEPVVHYGPFVMNSIDEIEQAIQDYNSGVFETY